MAMLASKEPTIYASAVSLALYTMKDIEAWGTGKRGLVGRRAPPNPAKGQDECFGAPLGAFPARPVVKRTIGVFKPNT